MKHARSDYDRFQDPAGKIPEDEPVMLLRGQDALAPAVLMHYARLLEANKAEPHMIDAVRRQSMRMAEWANADGRRPKIPDMPEETAR